MTAFANRSSAASSTAQRAAAERRSGAAASPAAGGVGGNSVIQILQDNCPELALHAGMVIEQLDAQVGTWQFSTDAGQTWRTVRTDLINRAGSLGLALDRGGFTVEDRDRAQGLYFVRYVDPEVDATGKGETAFAWDGVKANGERAPEGRYSIKATHTASDGTATALNTYVDATVDSVTIGSDGLYLNLPGQGTAPLDYVLRIGKSAS